MVKNTTASIMDFLDSMVDFQGSTVDFQDSMAAIQGYMEDLVGSTAHLHPDLVARRSRNQNTRKIRKRKHIKRKQKHTKSLPRKMRKLIGSIL